MSTKKHIVDYLSETRNRGGSDLHITGGAPPACRINGTLEALEDQDLSAEEAKELVLGVISESQRARLEEDLELDFPFQLKILADLEQTPIMLGARLRELSVTSQLKYLNWLNSVMDRQ